MTGNRTNWTPRRMRTVEALMAQGMGQQERLDRYTDTSTNSDGDVDE